MTPDERAKQVVIVFGRAADEPDAIIFGSDGLFWGRIVGSPDCTAEQRLALLQDAIRGTASPALAWTREPPTQPGWYLWKPTCGKIQLLMLELRGDSLTAREQGDDASLAVDELAGAWYGPIQEPPK